LLHDIQLAARYNEICKIKMPNTKPPTLAVSILEAQGAQFEICSMQNCALAQHVHLDSEDSIHSMPPQTFLFHPPPDDKMARERGSLVDTAISLAGRMSVTLFTSSCQIREDELKDAIRFLKSDEHPPAQKLHERLGQIRRTLGTITAAVDAHEASV
jgi:hypothetical protein